MSARTTPAADDYGDLMAAVGRYLASFDGLSPEDREECSQEAMVALVSKRAGEVVVTRPEGYAISCAHNAAVKRLGCHDRSHRESFDPLESEMLAIADSAAGPDELVIESDEDRRVHALIELLDDRERAVLKLRLDQGLQTKAIAARLGLSLSRAHKLLKRAGHRLVDAIDADELSEISRRQRSLLTAIVMGIASERQRKAGEKLVLEDPHARAILAELRGLGQKTAAALPLPPAAAGAEHTTGRLTELAAHVKGQLTDAAGVAKQHAAATYIRAGDPTPLAGARPGAVAALVASCIAAGGGAYCAVENLPDQLGDPLGLHQPAPETKQPQAKAPEPPTPPAPTSPPAPTPTQSPTPTKQTTPAPAAPVAPAAAAPAATPSPAPREQFGPEQQPTSTPPPPPSTGAGGSATSSSGGGGEQFGFER